MTRRRVVSLLAGLLFTGLPFVAGERFVMEDLGPLGPTDAFARRPEARNQRDEFVGTYYGSSARAFLWSRGVTTDLGVDPAHPHPLSTAAYDINSSGEIVVNANYLYPEPSRAYRVKNGQWTLLAEGKGAYDINESGQILLSGADSSSLWDSGKITELEPLPGATAIQATDLNDRGQIVGLAYFPGSVHAVLWEGGKATDLGTLQGARESVASAINQRGDVVGDSGEQIYYQTHAVLWRHGALIDLGTLPGDDVSSAWGVNDKGQVFGESVNLSTFEARYFLWDNGVMTDLSTVVSGPLADGICPSQISGPCFYGIDNRGLWATTASEDRLVRLDVRGSLGQDR
jgi:probable HAF family extracellular repeat protein